MDNTGSILRRNQRFLRSLHAISVSGGLGGNNAVRGDETDSDSETIRNESDDSDSDTIPYDIEETIRSRAGREIKIKVPLDYDDL